MMSLSHPLPEGFTELEVFAFGTALLIEALLGFVLCGLTLLTFLCVSDARTPSHLLLLNLSLADLGVCSNAFIAAMSSFLRYWPYGPEGCQLHGFHGFVTALSSISTMAAIAWDRHSTHCCRARTRWSTAVFLCAWTWLSSAFWAAMPLLGWGRYDYEPLHSCCTLDYTQADGNFISFVLPMAFFNFVVPVFIMVTSYNAVERKFKRTGHKFRTSLPVLSLVLCWAPYAALCLFACVHNPLVIPAKFRMIPAVLAKTSPTVNALLYSLGGGGQGFRGSAWTLLTGGAKQPQTPEQHSKDK
ncbi:RPE-retinal G protein-coupled receptor [Lethenteron reissneri]|uniref:RPE-retinal G protein-coupled receptor n=1 Tax=Lethenteron reissneri TaxID=7753 RepID=UPI002AB77049|nr:RPE-retinal G protein-coupled receptor [Lethenteron reissneri]